jgi:hypothetical protein
MKRLSLPLPAVLSTLLLLTAGSVHAGEIDFSWSLQPTEISIGGSDVKITPATPGSINFTQQTTQPQQTAAIGQLTIASSTTSGSDTFNATITMTGTFTTPGSSASQKLTFTDTLSGTLNATSVGTLTLNNTFLTNPAQTLVLGGESYNVMLATSTTTLPTAAGGSTFFLNALVSDNGPATGTVHQTPEPCSLALSGAAAVICGLFARRRRSIA